MPRRFNHRVASLSNPEIDIATDDDDDEVPIRRKRWDDEDDRFMQSGSDAYSSDSDSYEDMGLGHDKSISKKDYSSSTASFIGFVKATSPTKKKPAGENASIKKKTKSHKESTTSLQVKETYSVSSITKIRSEIDGSSVPTSFGKRLFERAQKRLDTSRAAAATAAASSTSTSTSSHVGQRRPADANFGAFEKHTKGIGMKLLEKMGFKAGEGLGRDKQGLAKPVEVSLRPKGMALGFGTFEKSKRYEGEG
eukprot:CAMPEP_0175055880 /NCGR_PEP_ID=MMETSP0052_2-20121109/10339_1 /TAXON_ID=51329 ORGANISM="Polytomella parva, Strain SAG 63-3" /NCGR_SAMPLE_ID=MMETSP0052_2 /ASSEMBLY_ACC=CAM_ASM_000194 /LENGTH=250 /DNA_ID=CAMNT_0016320801 /DNA_START=105 /DNA_END=853 /DNA_ORIENTATION=+